MPHDYSTTCYRDDPLVAPALICWLLLMCTLPPSRGIARRIRFEQRMRDEIFSIPTTVTYNRIPVYYISCYMFMNVFEH
jgi:hypothetical protein